MPRVTPRLALPLCAALAAVLTGCAAPKAAFEKEDFAQNDTYSRTFPAGSTTACDAGRRALLSQGYNIDKFEGSRVTGHKNFQGDDGQHTQISFNIDCASDGAANERATVFANAVQDRYSIKRTSSSASVGVSVLGQVSMPFGASDDSLVKTASQTVSRPAFYEGFFQLLQRFLPDAQAAAAPHVPPPGRGKAAAPKPPADPVTTPDAPADTLNPSTASGASAAGDKPAPEPARGQPAAAPANATGASTAPASPAPKTDSAAPTSAPAPAAAAATPAAPSGVMPAAPAAATPATQPATDAAK
ncbi:DUF2242 domain-containing protein [Achromobacter sp. NCFB-sbj8-Ac1-l]|uniref:DUF2242 domain-containing protein n=1 Tax=unclassified Achromobacter TaxID=2626865 RepID=UPI004046A742